MNSLPGLCIDPHILSLPTIGSSTPDSIEIYVTAIVDWGKTVTINGEKPYISNTVLDAIDEDQLYPWKDKLDAILKHYKIKSADAKTVSDVVQFLTNCPLIEDAVGLKALLLQEGKTTVDPVFVCTRLGSKTRLAFEEMLAMISLKQQGHGGDADPVALASIPNDNSGSKFQYLSYSSEVQSVEWKKYPYDKEIDLPYAISEHLSVFFSRDGLLVSVQPLSLWPDAAQDAIDCCVARLVASGADDSHKRSFIVGSDFVSSANTWKCGHDGQHAFTLIESCARIILGIPKHEVKPFFDSKGKQRKRADDAIAFRTHITKKNAGLRLMLWTLPDGTIEFANVGDKDELTIL